MKIKLLFGFVLMLAVALFVGNAMAEDFVTVNDPATGFLLEDNEGGSKVMADILCNCPVDDCCAFNAWTGDPNMFDFVPQGGLVDNNCNKDRCVNLYVSAVVKQWAYLHLDNTKFEWTIYKPGVFVVFLTEMCTLSNGWTSLKWNIIEDLVKPGINPDTIPAYYMGSLYKFPTVPGPNNPFWKGNPGPFIPCIMPPCCHKWYLYHKIDVSDDHQKAGTYKGKAQICLTLCENYGAFGEPIIINPPAS